MKKVIGVVFFLLLVACTVLPVSAAKTIKDTFVLKVDAPEEGRTPGSYLILSGQYEVTALKWEGELDDQGRYQAGKSYTLTFTVAEKENWRSKQVLNTTPGAFVMEVWLNFKSKLHETVYAEVLSISDFELTAKLIYTIPGNQQFSSDEYGSGVAKADLDVYPNAQRYDVEKIGVIPKGQTVKVLRAFVNNELPGSRHMIEYNGGIAYVKGMLSSSEHVLESVVIEGKRDPKNIPANLTIDYGSTEGNNEPHSITYVDIESFEAPYGGVPKLITKESDKYYVDSITYSTDAVNQMYYYTTATVVYKQRFNNPFDEKVTALKDGEVISRSEKEITVLYYAFSGNGDTDKSLTSEIKKYVDNLKDGLIYCTAAYAKAKINKTGNVARMYDYPIMNGIGKEIPDEVYIRDETIAFKFPTIKGRWYLVSDSPNGNLYYIPEVFISEIEYLGETMPGAPGVDRKTPYRFAGGNGTKDDPFLIETADQLNAIRFGYDMHYKLIADIDLSTWGNWTPIGGTPAYGGNSSDKWNKAQQGAFYFGGSLDGDGHVISGMTIKIDEETPFMMEKGNIRYYGLFSMIGNAVDDYPGACQLERRGENPDVIHSGAGVFNLGIVNYNIDVTYHNIKDVEDLRIWAGALAGETNYSCIHNVYTMNGNINFNIGVKANAIVYRIGGIIGVSNGCDIRRCFNAGNVTVNSDTYDLAGGGIAGGLMDSFVTECFNSGNITFPIDLDPTVSRNFTESYVGGIAAVVHREFLGDPKYCKIRDCYNSGNLSAKCVAGILVWIQQGGIYDNCYGIGNFTYDTYFEITGQPAAVATIHPLGMGTATRCYADGNSIQGAAWRYSDKLGRKVLVNVPEDNLPTPKNNFVATKVGSFNDVLSNAWYANAVRWAVDKKITSGTSETTFSPDNTCTRAQILTFMWRAVGSPKATGNNPFTDVAETDYFYDAALWAYGKGMVTGKTFEANTPCTRSATVVYLWKNAGSPAPTLASSFTDVNSGSDYASAVAWAVQSAITSGTSATTFSPDATCTRGQIVTFLNRAVK